MRSEQSEDQNPSPGEKVARPNEVRNSGSEEECGRQPKSQYDIADLDNGWMQNKTPEQIFGLLVIADLLPHSSSVRKSVPKSRFSDSFPPGEAIWVLPHHCNICEEHL